MRSGFRMSRNFLTTENIRRCCSYQRNPTRTRLKTVGTSPSWNCRSCWIQRNSGSRCYCYCRC